MLEPLLAWAGAQTPGTPATLDNLPADTGLAWAVVIVTGLGAACSVAVAAIKARRSGEAPSNSRTAPAVGVIDTITPRIDASQGYLDKWAAEVESKAKAAEARYEALERRTEARVGELEKRQFELQGKYFELQGKNARTEAEVESLRRENHELREELSLMRGRLMGHDK